MNMTVPKRFPAVRFFGTFLQVVAWILLVLSVLGAIGLALIGGASFFGNLAADTLPFAGNLTNNAIGASGIAGGLGLLISGLFSFLVFYVSGQMIHMGLAIEENTRLTAALLLRMHQESRIQDEQAAYAESGFVNEVYE
ncbi:MAG: hypothetical protein ACK2UO_06720 [Caldilineaceae bacterium]|jgi:hypothetical protein